MTYLDWIRTLPCAICGASSEAHHAGLRGLGQKAPDLTAIPLCAGHHRLRKDSAHVMGRRFWDFWRLDRDELIARLNRVWKLMADRLAA